MQKILLLILLSLKSVSSIYDIPVISAEGQTINLGDYAGKKMLLVNTASTSEFTSQYNSLEQLYQLYHDSLVIVVFPSNSFNHDTASIDSINNFINSQYSDHFLIAGKSEVQGDSISPVFQWLTRKANNGAVDVNIQNDFYKFLIDGSGRLVGAYDNTVNPTDSVIQDAIKTNY